MNEYDKTRPPLYQLAQIAAILRSETGCVWDREQTSASLKASLIEETYELYEAIENNDHENMREELGDLLYQIYAHAQIESEAGRYNIDDIANGISEKLVRRHPHVFGDAKAADSREVLKNWEQIKKKEKSNRESILDGIPKHLPALLRAFRVQEKASRVGFDWDRAEDALVKLDEEVAEFKEAAAETDNITHLAEEAGDILFTIVNVLRLKGIDAEEALQSSVNKFKARFSNMEKKCAEAGRDMAEMSQAELELLWEKAKGILRQIL
jgi:tetrapyrrole methylase family protein/MazG family protein